MGWLITGIVLLFLGCLPLGVRIRYNEQGFLAAVLLGKLPITLFPIPRWLKKLTAKGKKPKKEEAPREETKAPPAEPAAQEAPKQSPQGGSWKRFLPFVELGLDFLGDFRRKLRVEKLVLNLILAGDDPCDLAVNYGRAWAAVGNLLPRLERVLVIQKRDVQVQCDFLAEETKVVFSMDLTITLGRILGLGVVYGIRAIKLLRKKPKSEAQNDSELL